MICLFKIGLILTPGELKSWTRCTKKLTSTRHKNILLRIAHGDVFSNSRLFKFGLRETPSCSNCDEPVETIQHRIIECPKARLTWCKLEEAKSELKLNSLSDLTIENLLGTKDRLGKIELALQAELLLKLTSKSEVYCPSQMVRSAIKLVFNSEKLDVDTKNEYIKYKSTNR